MSTAARWFSSVDSARVIVKEKVIMVADLVGNIYTGTDPTNLTKKTTIADIVQISAIYQLKTGMFVILGITPDFTGVVLVGSSLTNLTRYPFGAFVPSGMVQLKDGHIIIVGLDMNTAKGVVAYGPTVFSLNTVALESNYTPTSVIQLLDERIVIVGSAGTIFYGANATNLTKVVSGTPVFYDVCQLSDNRIVIVGSSGAIRYGTNPASLTQTTSGTAILNKVIQMINGTIVAIGHYGAIRYGTNPASLTQTTSGTATLQSLIQLSDGRIMMVGSSGTIKYGTSPTNLTTITLGTENLYRLAEITM